MIITEVLKVSVELSPDDVRSFLTSGGYHAIADHYIDLELSAIGTNFLLTYKYVNEYDA